MGDIFTDSISDAIDWEREVEYYKRLRNYLERPTKKRRQAVLNAHAKRKSYGPPDLERQEKWLERMVAKDRKAWIHFLKHLKRMIYDPPTSIEYFLPFAPIGVVTVRYEPRKIIEISDEGK